MILLAAASATLVIVAGLLAFLLFRRPADAAEDRSRTPEEDAEEARSHLAKAMAFIDAKKDPEWNRKACKHLLEALKLGQNDGEAAESLAIVLATTGYPQHAMEVCELVLKDSYRLKKGSRLVKKDFQGRLERYRDKNPGPFTGLPLFTPEDAVAILRASRRT